MKWSAYPLFAILALCAGCRPANEPTSHEEHIQITRAAARASAKGTPPNFTGSVAVKQLFAATRASSTSGGSVTFEPGARSAWHTHPAGQTLIVTAGTGWVQEWGGAKQEVKAGDVVWTPPGVKHWHGATATESMTHLAIQEQVDGKAVEWMEPVTDEQYSAKQTVSPIFAGPRRALEAARPFTT